MRFLCGIIGLIFGVLLVHLFFLDWYEKVGWNAFVKEGPIRAFLGNEITANLKGLYFQKVGFGGLVGFIIGYFFAGRYERSDAANNTTADRVPKCPYCAEPVGSDDPKCKSCDRDLPAAPLQVDEKFCPFCAERIKAEARVCRHCQSDVSGKLPAIGLLAVSGSERKCHNCDQTVKAEARMCRYCRIDLPLLPALAGACPNCEAVIPLSTAACSCGANFGSNAGWKVKPLNLPRDRLSASTSTEGAVSGVSEVSGDRSPLQSQTGDLQQRVDRERTAHSTISTSSLPKGLLVFAVPICFIAALLFAYVNSGSQVQNQAHPKNIVADAERKVPALTGSTVPPISTNLEPPGDDRTEKRTFFESLVGSSDYEMRLVENRNLLSPNRIDKEYAIDLFISYLSDYRVRSAAESFGDFIVAESMMPKSGGVMMTFFVHVVSGRLYYLTYTNPIRNGDRVDIELHEGDRGDPNRPSYPSVIDMWLRANSITNYSVRHAQN